MTRLVYDTIQRHADPQGYAFPSRARIAEKAGCSISTVTRAIGVLRDAEILSVTPGSGRAASLYQLHYPATDRGCSPIHYDRPRARAPERPPERRAKDEAQDKLTIFRSPEAQQQAAELFSPSELDVLDTIQRMQQPEERQPLSLAACLSRVMRQPSSGELLPNTDAEPTVEHVQRFAQSYDGILYLAQHYRLSPVRVMMAISRTRRYRPSHFGAYLWRILARNRSGEDQLDGSREEVLAARASLEKLHRKTRALA